MVGDAGPYTIKYLKEGTFAHIHLAPGNEGTDVHIGVERVCVHGIEGSGY